MKTSAFSISTLRKHDLKKNENEFNTPQNFTFLNHEAHFQSGASCSALITPVVGLSTVTFNTSFFKSYNQ